MKQKDRLVIKNKYNGHCAYCGVILAKRFHIDHVHPKNQAHFLKSDVMKESLNLSINSIDENKNLKPACFRCNQWKKTFSVEEFRVEIESQAERLRSRQAGFRLAEDFGVIQEVNTAVIFYFEYPEFEGIE